MPISVINHLAKCLDGIDTGVPSIMIILVLATDGPSSLSNGVVSSVGDSPKAILICGVVIST